MSTNIRNISNKGIDKEIEKSCEAAKTCRYNLESSIVKNLNINAEGYRFYRKIKYDYSSYVNLYIFMKLININSQTEMVEHLRNNKRDRRKLGFDSTPHQTSISIFLNHILDDKLKEKLDYIVLRIDQIAGEKGIHLDTKNPIIKKRKKTSKKRNQAIRKKKLIKKNMKHYKKHLLSFITLKLGPNCIYKTEHFINLLFNMAQTDDFAENGSDTLRDTILDTVEKHGIRCPMCNKYIPSFAIKFSDKDPENQVICPRCDKIFRISPRAQSMFHHLKKFSIEDIQRLSFRYTDSILEHARKKNVLKAINTLACDTTGLIYYGNRNTPGIMNTEDDTGRMSYRYITISIVDNGRRFTLMALPFVSLQDKHKLLAELLEYVRKKIKIGLVLLDRGFYSAKIIELMNHFHLNYIILTPKNARIKKIIKKTTLPIFYRDYSMKNVIHSLILNISKIRDRDGKIFVYALATNLPMDDSDIEGSIERICSLYRKRWGIETIYRVIKKSFGLRTTSRDFRIRLFYFLFSVILYNLWILIDILVWFDLFTKVGDVHQVKSKYFRSLLLIIDPGG